MKNISDKIDCLFLHTGRNLPNNTTDTLIIPAGLYALKNFLKKHKVKSYIFNYSLYLNPNQKLFKLIKKLYPELNIVVGGITATVFCREIIKDIREIDFIIYGDAEIPLLNLIKIIKKGSRNYSKIPNLVYRNNRKIIINKQDYVITKKIFDSLIYSDISNMDKKILKGYWRLHIEGNKKTFEEETILRPRFYYVPTRGCRHSCSWCGGSNYIHKKFFKRFKPIEKNINTVYRDLLALRKNKIKLIYIDGQPEKTYYFIKLFKLFKAKEFSFPIVFETCIVTTELLKVFANTFKNHLNKSRFIFWIGSGSEHVRRKNRSFFISNREIYNILDTAYDLKINLNIRFTVGLPFESENTFADTIKMISQIILKYNYEVNIELNPLEPFSPMFVHPRKYKIKNTHKKFIDYINYPLDYNNLGYHSKFMKNPLEQYTKLNKMIRNLQKKKNLEFTI